MDEKQIIEKLKGQVLTFSKLSSAFSVQNKAEENRLHSLLNAMINDGVIYKSKSDYSLLIDRDMLLARVTNKYKNFVILKSIPDNIDIKISGKESDSYLIGDLLYVKKFKRDEYHAIDALKQITQLKGNYALNKAGKAILEVPALNVSGKVIYIIDQDKNIKLTNGDYILCDIISMSQSMIQVKAVKILVKVDEVGADITRIIVKNDAPIDFSTEALEEAKRVPSTVSEKDKEGRVDFTNHFVITIDGNDSRDFDDAVEVERHLNGYKVIVHIADVTHYMKENSALDKDAFDRGTSIYVADRVVPMLPFSLSTGICSLNPDEVRLTLSATMLIDAKGNVFQKKVEKGFIKSSARLTYQKCNDYFAGKECDYSKEIKKNLDLLKEVSQLIRKNRINKGAMDLSSTELKFHLDEKGNPLDVIKETQGVAENLIEDLMVLANCSIASLLKEKGIPVLYRIHDNPPNDKVLAFKDFLRKVDPRLVSIFPKNENISSLTLMEFMSQIEDENTRYAINSMLLRMMAKAKYSPDEIGHFGLVEDDYCHFTSPIRRYPDDIIHRYIKKYLIDKQDFVYDILEGELERDGKYLSACEIRSDTIERQVDDLESCKYLKDKIGMVLSGRISSLMPKGMFIETELGIEGFLPYHCIHGDVFKFDERKYKVVGKHHENISFSLGEKIDVAVCFVSVAALEIDFSTIEFYEKYLKDLDIKEIYDIVKEGIHIDKPVEDKPIYLHSYNEMEKLKEEVEYKEVTNDAGFVIKVPVDKKSKKSSRDFSRSRFGINKNSHSRKNDEKRVKRNDNRRRTKERFSNNKSKSFKRGRR